MSLRAKALCWLSRSRLGSGSFHSQGSWNSSIEWRQAIPRRVRRPTIVYVGSQVRRTVCCPSNQHAFARASSSMLCCVVGEPFPSYVWVSERTAPRWRHMRGSSARVSSGRTGHCFANYAPFTNSREPGTQPVAQTPQPQFEITHIARWLPSETPRLRVRTAATRRNALSATPPGPRPRTRRRIGPAGRAPSRPGA